MPTTVTARVQLCQKSSHSLLYAVSTGRSSLHNTFNSSTRNKSPISASIVSSSKLTEVTSHSQESAMQCPRSISPARCASPTRVPRTKASWVTSSCLERDQPPAQVFPCSNTTGAGEKNLVFQSHMTYWEEELQRLRSFRAQPSRFRREAMMMSASDNGHGPGVFCDNLQTVA